jgi:hypothetical protein
MPHLRRLASHLFDISFVVLLFNFFSSDVARAASPASSLDLHLDIGYSLLGIGYSSSLLRGMAIMAMSSTSSLNMFCDCFSVASLPSYVFELAPCFS